MKQWKKAVLCVIIILVMALPRTVCAIHVPDSTGAEEFSYVAQGNGYDAFLQTAAYAPAGGESILLSENETVEDGNGRLGLKFTFVSSNSGRYALKLSYFVENEDTRVIERRVEINGAVPYDELKSVILPREYTSGEICTDIGGNELRPEQVAAHRMTTNYVFDHTGKYSDPLSINIEYGENVLVIWEVTGAATIHQVELVPADSIRSYEEVLKTYAGIPVYDGEAIQLEAEDAS